PIAISVRQPLLAALPVLGADQLADLHLHQLLHDPAQALAQKVDAVFLKQVANDLLSSHPLRLGHRGDSPLVNSLAGTDESERRGGRTSTRLRPTRSYTYLEIVDVASRAQGVGTSGCCPYLSRRADHPRAGRRHGKADGDGAC